MQLTVVHRRRLQVQVGRHLCAILLAPPVWNLFGSHLPEDVEICTLGQLYSLKYSQYGRRVIF